MTPYPLIYQKSGGPSPNNKYISFSHKDLGVTQSLHGNVYKVMNYEGQGSVHMLAEFKQIQASLNPATWLSFLYHTAFYQVPYNSCKNNLFCLAILSNIGTLYFKAYAPKLVMYVCLFYLISSCVILLDSLHHRIPICFV